MEKIFREISNQENCKLEIEHEASWSKLISFSPFLDENNGLRINSLKLRIEYRNQMIILENRIGDDHVGKMKCSVNSRVDISNFKIKNRSHYLRLLNSKLDILKIQCDNVLYKEYLKNKLDELGLEEIAKESQFRPSIIGFQGSNYQITMDYSLSFKKKKEVLRPLIELMKSIIDYIENEQ